jgi:quinohemoprotein ethanol dehydrogenase
LADSVIEQMEAPMWWRRRWRLACIAALIAMPAIVGVQSPSLSGAGTSANWALSGGDLSNTRYSTLTQITPANVRTLAGSWTKVLDGALRATPVVSDGLMFLPTRTQLLALDATNGNVVWSHRPSVPFNTLAKGVSLGQGLVFAGLSNTTMIAVRQATGELVWTYTFKSKVTGEVSGPISSPATYASGIVLVPASGGDSNLRGRLIALDATTGKERWVFDAVPAPGEPGFESWPRAGEAWLFGGGAIWMPPSVDPDLGLVYVGVGNANPQFGGDVREGDNLFTSCVVALDLQTGKLVWYKQLVHHDIWDYDLSTPLVLYEMNTGDTPRKAVAVMRTDGYLFAFDRKTAAPLFPIAERAVPQDKKLHTSSTQPFPVGGDQIGPNCAEPGLMPEGFTLGCYYEPLRPDMPNLAVPFMTMRFSPMAYSPDTRLLYATACVAPWWVRRPDNGWLHGQNVHVPGQKWYGIVAALDSRTNKIAWQKRVPVPLCGGSGAMATSTGLVFNASPDGVVHAYDGRSGDSLWDFQVGTNGQLGPIGPASGPVISYEIGGRQFVAVLMERALWAFALDGKLPPRPAAGPVPTEQPFEGAVEQTTAVRLGTVIKQTNPVERKTEDWNDEHGIAPVRVSITPGTTITWRNTTAIAHTIAARDRSWSTGPIKPGESATRTFDAAGTYTYICTDHPWSIAQLIVESK